MPTPHKHAEIIKAWADGAEIEWYDPISKAWYAMKAPSWSIHTEYRVRPHKWQKEIDAFKAGKTIQVRATQTGRVEWMDVDVLPPWDLHFAEFRIKPEVVRYRLFFWKPSILGFNEVKLAMVTKEENDRESRESWRNFVAWVSDWQEAEIPTP